MKDGDKRQETSTKIEEPDPDSSNILQPSWVRRIVCSSDEVDRIFLENRYYFLLHIGILFWIIFLFTSKMQR
jgi:hypothetical protein